MFYLKLDADGYLLSVSTTPMEGPSIDTLDGIDLSGVRMRAYRWDGKTLVLDETRLAELEQKKTTERQTLEKAMYDASVQKEAQAELLAAQINTLDVDDDTALRWKDLYPEWIAGADYTEGYKVKRNGLLWRVREGQVHTSQAGWEPENAPALWENIDEAHAGTLEDPIPYGGNMALTAGLYYTQDGVVYLCTRDTVTPVYHALNYLVGLYVEPVN